MKYLLPAAFIITLFSSCNTAQYHEISHDVYAAILDKEFGRFSGESPYIVAVNDTIEDFNDELGILIYSVQKNDRFFKENCKGDSSFKDFILAAKAIETGVQVMDIELLKSKTKISVNTNKFIKSEAGHHSINFSKIIFNKTNNKAILFIVGNSSASWLFVELNDKRWTVKHEILSWII